MKKIQINSNNENQRFDKFLLRFLNDAPKSFVYKMLRKKNILLNDKKAEGMEILKNGDLVTLFISDDTISKFSSEKPLNENASKIDIIFEDNNVLIVNKPRGALSHPESDKDDNTMIDRILSYISKCANLTKNEDFTPSLCNRLDRNTSGILICAKTLSASQSINLAIKDKMVDKRYEAIIFGKLPGKGEISGFHTKNEKTNTATISQLGDGKPVLTKFTTKFTKGNFSLAEIELITGKTHQIRASFKAFGAPVLGDVKYGNQVANRLFYEKFGLSGLFLHASSVTFLESRGRTAYLCNKRFEAPLPDHFLAAISAIKN